jgi:hypothetical protein
LSAQPNSKITRSKKFGRWPIPGKRPHARLLHSVTLKIARDF